MDRPEAQLGADALTDANADSEPRVVDAGVGFGHGKVILLGEHAVVFGYPALAAGLSKGLRARAHTHGGADRLTVPRLQLDVSRGHDSPVGRAWTAILDRLKVGAVDVLVDGDLPASAGLGSSAAWAFAVASAVASAYGHPREAALAAAHDAEVIFHGTPSGIDLAAASTGVVGRFQRESGWVSVPVLQPMTLCVGLSGRTRETRALVDGVRRLRERTSVVTQVMDTMGAVVEAGARALGEGHIDELGRLFDIAHGLLAALRVSSPELEALVHAARAAGAIGAKLTGAGGGGAVIALAPGHEKDVLERWQRDGFEGFATTIAGAQQGDGLSLTDLS